MDINTQEFVKLCESSNYWPGKLSVTISNCTPKGKMLLSFILRNCPLLNTFWIALLNDYIKTLYVHFNINLQTVGSTQNTHFNLDFSMTRHHPYKATHFNVPSIFKH